MVNQPVGDAATFGYSSMYFGGTVHLDCPPTQMNGHRSRIPAGY
jgi:hypothetical protein